MSSKILLAVGLVLGWCFSGVHASAARGALRYDGIYYRTARDAVTQHFRFYPDGTVISAATHAKKTPKKIAHWFNRDWPAQAKGRYAARNRSIEFTLQSDISDKIPAEFQKKVPRQLKYAGTIASGYLKLRRAGEPEPKRYNFVKIRFAK